MGPSLCMLWGLGPHGPKLPQFSPSSGPLGPRACFCSQSVHGGQWLLRGHFRLSARPSPAEGGRPDSSLKFGFRGFSPILAEQEIPRRGRGRRPLWHHGPPWGPPTAPTKGTYHGVPRGAVNCTTTVPPSPASCLLAGAPGSGGKGISVPRGEQPLPQKRVVLSRTLRTAAPPQRLRAAQPLREAGAHCLCLPPV